MKKRQNEKKKERQKEKKKERQKKKRRRDKKKKEGEKKIYNYKKTKWVISLYWGKINAIAPE